MRVALALILLGLLTTTARADHELALGSWTRALRSPSANAVTANDLGGGALEYAHSLDVPALPQLEVWADAGMTWGGTSGTMFQTMTTDVDNLGFTIGGRARYAVWKRLRVGGRVDVGTTRTALSLAADNTTLSGRGWGGIADAFASLDLLAVTSPRFSLGLRFELGYVKTTGVGLTLAPDRPDDGTLKLPMSAASIGHLDLSGPSFGFRVISQF
jgi:hypothetical protein